MSCKMPPADNHAAVQRRVHLRIQLGVFPSEIDARPGNAQGVFQPAGDEGVMVVPRRRNPQQLPLIVQQDRLDQRPQGDVGDLLAGDGQQLIEHLLRLEAGLRQAHGRIEAVGRVGVDDLADLADVELRAVVRVAIGGADLVEDSGVPMVAAVGGQGGIVPNGKAHFAEAVAEGDAKIRLALPGGQLLLGGQQHEDVGLLAGNHFGQGGQGHGSGGHGSLDFCGGFVSVAAATKRSGAADAPIVMENLGKENAPGRRRFASAFIDA